MGFPLTNKAIEGKKASMTKRGRYTIQETYVSSVLLLSLSLLPLVMKGKKYGFMY